MTVLDQVRSGGRAIIESLLDKEPVNYIEAGALYGMVATGRYHVAVLSAFYNHAQDPALRELIKEAIDQLSEATVKKGENLLEAGGAKAPTIDYPDHSLEGRLDIPAEARLEDMVIATALADIDVASQVALVTAIHQCYAPEISLVLRSHLIKALDWSQKLLQLMLNRGWLPQVPKVAP